IAVNTTAFLEKTDPMHLKVLGNPTEGALLLWLNAQGEHYEIIRSSAKMVEQLTFSTERKYMATVVDSFLHPGKRLLFVKGAPEIVLSLCKEIIVDGKEVPAEEYSAHIDQQLADYQAKAMRTLGFAYAEIDKDQEISCFENGQLRKNLPLKYLGIVAISDPVRSDVPEAIQSCLDAGIDIKIVTGDTPGTATEIARQIKLWKEEYTEENRITGPEFGLLSEEELEERVLKLKIISRARPMDKERLVKALQRKGQVVAVTGDGTNDAPALNAAQVGLSMGDGTSVAKEASDITILDNSFTSINRAVMWGRSLYQNVQRFILFQMTINVAACLTVLIGAFLGSESPLTVTQMLWVNLIMDTFAAMALASLPPNEEVMKDKPRKEKEHIIQPTMTRRILSVGFLFVVVLFGLMQYFKYEDISSLKDFDWNLFVQDFFRFSKDGHGFSLYEKSLFFTFFVMFQFWNMFNAKAYKTHGSAFKGIKDCLDGFVLVGLLIVVGQIIIVNYGGQMFSVAPLSLSDWIIITLVSSLVLWIGEIIRFLTPKKSKTI
ncbi:MAG: cation-translocating P-type ATPase, partial [Bacteroidales bacterium]